MTFDTGTIIAIAAVLLFYLRLIILQRHHNRQAAAQPPSFSKRKTRQPDQPAVKPGFRIISWYLLGAGLALILIGALMTVLPVFSSTLRSLWWVVLTIGIALLSFSLR